MIRPRTLAALCAAPALVVVLSGLALAQQPPPGPPREPPPEAFAACDAKSEGDACKVSFREREIHGICTPELAGKRLFCRPTEPPPPPPDHS